MGKPIFPYGTLIVMTCKCGKEFKVVPYLTKKRKVCSRECSWKYGKRNKVVLKLRKWNNVTHINGKYHHLHGVWRNMVSRCFNPKNCSYSDYGRRGIAVCKSWQNWDVFHDWAMAHGYRRGLWIERQNNDKNYCPSNCVWEIPKVSQCNRRNTPSVKVIKAGCEDVIYSATPDAALALGVCYNTVRNALVKKQGSALLRRMGVEVCYV